MSNYTVTTNFGAKDSLPSGNAAKVIKGSEFKQPTLQQLTLLQLTVRTCLLRKLLTVVRQIYLFITQALGMLMQS
jgi:hypothetical protein